MIRKLKLSSTITVEALRANRSLRVQITGEISAGLRGEIHPDLWGDVSDLWGDVSGLRGNVSDLRGNVSDLRGDVSDLRGDVSGLRGNVSDLRGNVSGLSGNVDECEISDEERENGVSIADLVEPAE